MHSVLILAANGVEDQDLSFITEQLSQRGIGWEIASVARGAISGARGKTFEAQLDLDQALAAAGDFKALVMPGGKDAETLANDKSALALVGLFHDQGKIVASVCDGCALTLHGVNAHGKRIAAQPEEFMNIWGAQASFEEQAVVVDGNLITANGEDMPAFVDAIAKHLG